MMKNFRVSSIDSKLSKGNHKNLFKFTLQNFYKEVLTSHIKTFKYVYENDGTITSYMPMGESFLFEVEKPDGTTNSHHIRLTSYLDGDIKISNVNGVTMWGSSFQDFTKESEEINELCQNVFSLLDTLRANKDED